MPCRRHAAPARRARGGARRGAARSAARAARWLWWSGCPRAGAGTRVADARCLLEVQASFTTVKEFSFVPFSYYTQSDDLVAGCVKAGMNSWRVERNLVVCLPRICTPRFMAAGLLKHTVPALLVRDVAGVDLDSASVNITDAVRLQPLSSVHLDFIIAGYCHSGTTSLHHHLRSHPSVDMWHKEVHELLWQPVFTRAELRHLTSMRRDRTRGIRSTWAGTAPGLFNRLSALPSRPKMIVMARDPLSQLDSILSHGTTAFFNPIGQELGMDLVRTGTNAVYNMQASMLEERVLVVPTLRLSIAPDETMATVQHWLGLPPDHGHRRHGRRHVRPTRLPVRGRQTLCDVPASWRPDSVAELGGLGFLDLLHGALARERERLRALLGFFSWPAPLLHAFSCPGGPAVPSGEALGLGARGFCAAAAALRGAGSLGAACPTGAACEECCVRQQAACPLDRACCAPVLGRLWDAARAAVREAFCGAASAGGRHGCCTRFLQTP